MIPNRNKHSGIAFSAKDARVFRDVFEVYEEIYGDEASNYIKGFAKIWIRYRQLKDQGIRVRISTPRYGRQSLLVISKSYPK
jgi:hypothetical protein